MPLLSITTDYCTSLGDPELPLRLIAAAGFTHLHWCHHFNDDFVYGEAERKVIRAMMARYGLRLLDVHGSYGIEKRWWSLNEMERQAGVELVLNRAELFQALEGEGNLIMHIPFVSTIGTEEENDGQRAQFRQVIRSLDEVVPRLEKMGIRLALENMPNDTWELLEEAVHRYPESEVGFCYDSGHGNLNRTQLPLLERNKARLHAMHTNDNNGTQDQHQPPFMGTVDWERWAGIIATSGYQGPFDFEITMRATPYLVSSKPVLMPPAIQTFTGLPAQPEENQRNFLEDAFKRCCELEQKVRLLQKKA